MELKIFSTSFSEYLASKIAKAAQIKLGQVISKRFADGECWVKFKDSVRDDDVFIIGATRGDQNIIELLAIIDAAKRASARRITAVIPYFGYARQDRKDQPRTPIMAKVMVNLIQIVGTDRVITMDLHNDAIQGFFDIPVDHLYASKAFIPIIQRYKKSGKPLTVVATDVGCTPRAKKYARFLNCPFAIIDKSRPQHNQVKINGHIGDLTKGIAIPVDDIIDTGGTFCQEVNYIHQQGANPIIGCVTHPILSGNGLDLLIDSPWLEKFYTTDTLPLPPLPQYAPKNKIVVISVANIFAQAILATHKHKSISHLFWENRN